MYYDENTVKRQFVFRHDHFKRRSAASPNREAPMSSKDPARENSMRHRIAAAGAVAILWAGIGAAAADTLADPPVFTSQNGVLDIMMVAMPRPIPGISYT